jgi:hypothetical protein
VWYQTLHRMASTNRKGVTYVFAIERDSNRVFLAEEAKSGTGLKMVWSENVIEARPPKPMKGE